MDETKKNAKQIKQAHQIEVQVPRPRRGNILTAVKDIDVAKAIMSTVCHIPLLPEVKTGSTFALRRSHSRILSRCAAL